jgi:hypothetical protein
VGAGYEISVKDAERIVKLLDELLTDFVSATADLRRLAVPTGQYGQVGGTAASASATTQNQLTATLEALATVLQKLTERVRASARGYDGKDRQFASTLDQLTAGQADLRL